jgi:hypothetical protein
VISFGIRPSLSVPDGIGRSSALVSRRPLRRTEQQASTWGSILKSTLERTILTP